MKNDNQALIDQILALQLLNPVSRVDVELEDIYAYLDEAETPPSVEGFKEWLLA
ncbi:hypothetical protein KQ747_15360 [Listeria monocytogenes]|nr:hypothetical protein [Listeria monocytogenes]